MHYGEVFSTWNYVMTANKVIADTQMTVNHTGDDDLKKLLNELVETGKSEVKQVSEILKANGVALPPSALEPPTVQLNDIPVGARYPDADVAATASVGLAMGLVACSQIMDQSIREDIA